MSKDFIIVLTTVPNMDVANKIAKSLVESKLAACVNIISNVKSVYFWENKIYEDNELILLIKTVANNFKEVEKKIKELHPYQLPEIISLEVREGLLEYLNWIRESVVK
jgi:periplasmic divalent cation tolerance protein